MLELKAAPNPNGKTEIRYTTDGSDPKLSGGTYDGPFSVPKGTTVVLAIAERDGIQSEVETISINWDKQDTEKPINPELPLTWKRKQQHLVTTEAYAFMDRLKQHNASISGVHIMVTGEHWAELTLHEKLRLGGIQVYEAVEAVRKLLAAGQLGIEATAVHFEKGQDFLDWVQEVKADIRPGEVTQP